MRFRKLAADLGGVWIKVGQFLSARVDILSTSPRTGGVQDEVLPPSKGETDHRVELHGSPEAENEWVSAARIRLTRSGARPGAVVRLLSSRSSGGYPLDRGSRSFSIEDGDRFSVTG
jgi:hypothetical protein